MPGFGIDNVSSQCCPSLSVTKHQLRSGGGARGRQALYFSKESLLFLSSLPTQFHKGLFEKRGNAVSLKEHGVGFREIAVPVRYLPFTGSMTVDWKQSFSSLIASSGEWGWIDEHLIMESE